MNDKITMTSRRKNAEAIYRAAEIWRDKCLLNDGSLFGDDALWTKANFSKKFVSIATAYKNEPEFMSRLKRQMKDMGPVHCKLAAELLWVFYLCDDRRTLRFKENNVRTAWNWSDDEFTGHALLGREYLHGIGGAGMAFSRHQGKEFFLLVVFVKQWKNLAESEQKRLLASDRAFAAQWDKWIPVWEKEEVGGRWKMQNRGIRHQIMHLLFPDYFRPIFNKRDKFNLIKKSTGKNVSGDFRAEIDEALFQIPRKNPMARYWVVGSLWGRTDKTNAFVSDGRWENGYAGSQNKQNYESTVKQVQPGDKIAIKATFVQKHGLPFDFGGKSCSAMKIKARGTVTGNAGDGQHITVDWEPDYKPRTWYIKNTKWRTLHELHKDDEEDDLLIDFIFSGDEQDYEYWLDDYDLEERMIPLNQIFYGPPGTGKTYLTTNAALKIIDPAFYEQNSDRAALKKRFEELQEEGQIGFVTFHQSFGYEEFVEGIRPVMAGAVGSDGQNVSYEISDGIFKRMCDRAKSTEEPLRIDDAIEKLLEECEDQWVSLETVRGKKFEITYRGGKTLTCKLASGYEVPVNIEAVKKVCGGENPKNFWRPHNIVPIVNHVKKNGLGENPDGEQDSPHVLIIDEINRGNISRIFGELITLIEESKRIGNEEETKVKLPYSPEPFGVPKNLYIIGTMNTADRSIALLDTALRRRFRFFEMMPKPELLEGIDVDGVEVEKVLAEMNARIEAIYDRDHQIGHSFFLRLEDKPDIDTLASIFEHEVLPLLQEYFYDDWEKIDLVLNKNGFLAQKNPPKMPGDAGVEDKKIWSVDTAALRKPANYQRIYADAAESDDS
ncbi:MAG: AAA family ATPase [Gammaproteobacteria bacterium]